MPDQALRFAGGTNLAFGVINLGLGLSALRGIARDSRAFARSAAERRTRAGLLRAHVGLLRDERRESVSYALNLGLDAAYASMGIAAIAASPSRCTGIRWR